MKERKERRTASRISHHVRRVLSWKSNSFSNYFCASPPLSHWPGTAEECKSAKQRHFQWSTLATLFLPDAEASSSGYEVVKGRPTSWRKILRWVCQCLGPGRTVSDSTAWAGQPRTWCPLSSSAPAPVHKNTEQNFLPLISQQTTSNALALRQKFAVSACFTSAETCEVDKGLKQTEQ